MVTAIVLLKIARARVGEVADKLTAMEGIIGGSTPWQAASTWWRWCA